MMGGYLTIKRKDLLIPVITWTKIKRIMLNKRSQTQKAT